MNFKEKGWVRIHRQVIESDIWVLKPDKWLKIWIYILLHVNHQDNKQFKRGTNFFQYSVMADKTGATSSQIDHCIRWLKSATMIATIKATRGLVISVLNYDKYQSNKDLGSDTNSDSIGEIEAKQKRNRSDTINKNDKNEKNEKKYSTNYKNFSVDKPMSASDILNKMYPIFKKN